eukprot:Rmarinus@m.13091
MTERSRISSPASRGASSSRSLGRGRGSARIPGNVTTTNRPTKDNPDGTPITTPTSASGRSPLMRRNSNIRTPLLTKKSELPVSPIPQDYGADFVAVTCPTTNPETLETEWLPLISLPKKLGEDFPATAATAPEGAKTKEERANTTKLREEEERSRMVLRKKIIAKLGGEVQYDSMRDSLDALVREAGLDEDDVPTLQTQATSGANDDELERYKLSLANEIDRRIAVAAEEGNKSSPVDLPPEVVQECDWAWMYLHHQEKAPAPEQPPEPPQEKGYTRRGVPARDSTRVHRAEARSRAKIVSTPGPTKLSVPTARATKVPPKLPIRPSTASTSKPPPPPTPSPASQRPLPRVATLTTAKRPKTKQTADTSPVRTAPSKTKGRGRNGDVGSARSHLAKEATAGAATTAADPATYPRFMSAVRTKGEKHDCPRGPREAREPARRSTERFTMGGTLRNSRGGGLQNWEDPPYVDDPSYKRFRTWKMTSTHAPRLPDAVNPPDTPVRKKARRRSTRPSPHRPGVPYHSDDDKSSITVADEGACAEATCSYATDSEVPSTLGEPTSPPLWGQSDLPRGVWNPTANRHMCSGSMACYPSQLPALGEAGVRGPHAHAQASAVQPTTATAVGVVNRADSALFDGQAWQQPPCSCPQSHRPQPQEAPPANLGSHQLYEHATPQSQYVSQAIPTAGSGDQGLSFLDVQDISGSFDVPGRANNPPLSQQHLQQASAAPVPCLPPGQPVWPESIPTGPSNYSTPGGWGHMGRGEGAIKRPPEASPAEKPAGKRPAIAWEESQLDALTRTREYRGPTPSAPTTEWVSHERSYHEVPARSPFDVRENAFSSFAHCVALDEPWRRARALGRLDREDDDVEGASLQAITGAVVDEVLRMCAFNGASGQTKSSVPLDSSPGVFGRTEHALTAASREAARECTSFRGVQSVEARGGTDSVSSSLVGKLMVDAALERIRREEGFFGNLNGQPSNGIDSKSGDGNGRDGSGAGDGDRERVDVCSKGAESVKVTITEEVHSGEKSVTDPHYKATSIARRRRIGTLSTSSSSSDEDRHSVSRGGSQSPSHRQKLSPSLSPPLRPRPPKPRKASSKTQQGRVPGQNRLRSEARQLVMSSESDSEVSDSESEMGSASESAMGKAGTKAEVANAAYALRKATMRAAYTNMKEDSSAAKLPLEPAEVIAANSAKGSAITQSRRTGHDDSDSDDVEWKKLAGQYGYRSRAPSPKRNNVGVRSPARKRGIPASSPSVSSSSSSESDTVGSNKAARGPSAITTTPGAADLVCAAAPGGDPTPLLSSSSEDEPPHKDHAQKTSPPRFRRRVPRNNSPSVSSGEDEEDKQVAEAFGKAAGTLPDSSPRQHHVVAPRHVSPSRLSKRSSENDDSDDDRVARAAHVLPVPARMRDRLRRKSSPSPPGSDSDKDDLFEGRRTAAKNVTDPPVKNAADPPPAPEEEEHVEAVKRIATQLTDTSVQTNRRPSESVRSFASASEGQVELADSLSEGEIRFGHHGAGASARAQQSLLRGMPTFRPSGRAMWIGHSSVTSSNLSESPSLSQSQMYSSSPRSMDDLTYSAPTQSSDMSGSVSKSDGETSFDPQTLITHHIPSEEGRNLRGRPGEHQRHQAQGLLRGLPSNRVGSQAGGQAVFATSDREVDGYLGSQDVGSASGETADSGPTNSSVSVSVSSSCDVQQALASNIRLALRRLGVPSA